MSMLPMFFRMNHVLCALTTVLEIHDILSSPVMMGLQRTDVCIPEDATRSESCSTVVFGMDTFHCVL